MAYLANPAQLVQVDPAFDRYEWLVNRAVHSPTGVTFVIQTDRDLPYVYPGGRSPASTQIDCGQYRILDFGHTEIPLGPPHN